MYVKVGIFFDGNRIGLFEKFNSIGIKTEMEHSLSAHGKNY